MTSEQAKPSGQLPKRRRGGRPASPETKRPKKGKGIQVLTRVTQELRDALDAEADRTGRSLSQVAERAIEDGLKLWAEGDPLGGLELAPALVAMAAASRAIISEVGSPSAYLGSRDAILRAWAEIADNMLPQPAPTEAELLAARTARISREAQRALVELGFWTEVAMESGTLRSVLWNRYADAGHKQISWEAEDLPSIRRLAETVSGDDSKMLEALNHAIDAEQAAEEAEVAYSALRAAAADRGSDFSEALGFRAVASSDVHGLQSDPAPRDTKSF